MAPVNSVDAQCSFLIMVALSVTTGTPSKTQPRHVTKYCTKTTLKK
uniref:Uncharacterized protein n=1 Tax=Anguilla anguilla TaxID=7936 RepID=A0A0E9SC14_ANGAN